VPDHFGDFRVDDQFQSCGDLDRQVCRSASACSLVIVCVLELLQGANFNRKKGQAECPASFGGFIQFQFIESIYRVPQDGDARCRGNCFLNQLHALSREFRSHQSKAGDIAARVRQALDQAYFDRVAASNEHNRNCCRRLSSGKCLRGTYCKDNVYAKSDECQHARVVRRRWFQDGHGITRLKVPSTSVRVVPSLISVGADIKPS